MKQNNHGRNRANWVLEPEFRITINQQIGGSLYDLVDKRYKKQSNGRYKEYMSYIRQDTRMSDRTLKSVFLGKEEKIRIYYRVIFAIRELISQVEFTIIWNRIGKLLDNYVTEHGEEFLEEEAEHFKPHHKNNKKHKN